MIRVVMKATWMAQFYCPDFLNFLDMVDILFFNYLLKCSEYVRYIRAIIRKNGTIKFSK